MALVDFLQFSVDSIRSSVKGIDDSYRNPWDILAELAQNSVDAIATAGVKGKIRIEINSKDKSIRFEDNGCGISAEQLPKLLSLFSSGKKDDASTVGEKGVGLKFVLFQSTYFEIVSSDGKSASRATIRDARLWKKQSNDVLLQMDHNIIPIEDKPTPGTTVFIKDVEFASDDEDEKTASIFTMNATQIAYLLRTKTAIGDTRKIWDDSLPSIEVILEYEDFNGDLEKTVVENKFCLPTEVISDSDIRNVEDYEAWTKKADRQDNDKRAYLTGKVLTLSGFYYHRDYRRINYWLCFVPSRRDWDSLTEKRGLATKLQLEDSIWADAHSTVLFASGIYTATKGMPTGITIENPATGNAGYWPNFFMIFQEDALNFDIGRKSIHGNIRNIYKEKAKELFNRVTKYVTRYTNSQPVSTGTGSNFDRFDIRQGVNDILDLNSNAVKFVKNPGDQEASVSALFFELIGNGMIDDIEPIYLGYRQKYDLYANYVSSAGKQFKFFEFKSRLRNITKDFQDASKVFDEMDFIICWDINDEDIQKLKDFGIDCEEFSQGSLHAVDIPKCVTHRLSIANVNPIYAIDLKKLL